jgi:hypothetical protein
LDQQGRRPGRLSARGRRGAGEDDYPESRDSYPAHRPARDTWSQPDSYYDDPDGDVPPWAGPGIYPAGPGRRERRPPSDEDYDDDPGPAEEAEAPAETGRRFGGRAAAARSRRSRRRIVAVGGAAVVVVLVVLAILGDLPFQGSSPKAAPRSHFVTTFQQGDIRTAPSACQAVTAPTLGQYLPGTPTKAVIQSSRMQSQCTWTLDARPVYRVLEITIQAYGPSLLATGNGSATYGAVDAYQNDLQAIKNPPKSTHLPKATLGVPAGLGDTAFSALQVWHSKGSGGKSHTVFVTVVTRERNVVITVTLQGLKDKRYHRVSVPTIQAGALAVAHEAVAKLG